MSWQEFALCRRYDPELFFPVAEEGSALGDAARASARRVCRACPVQLSCLNWALENGEDYGVWGGMTESERRALHRVILVDA